jgi:glycerol-3-phosphate dehydrogenase
MSAERRNGVWSVSLQDSVTGATESITARALVNAAGPWVESVLARAIGAKAKARIRLVQGSHIVVRKLYDHDRAYILQNADGRVIFAIPYEGDFTLIGTTDNDYTGDPKDVRATAGEIAYLCAAVSRDFKKEISPKDVVWSYSGVRPLYDDGASEAKAATRDYVFELDGGESEAPVLSIYGGKITTYRKLAEEALETLKDSLPKASKLGPGWTGKEPLPGGDLADLSVSAAARHLRETFPFLTAAHADRIARAYGTRADVWLKGARELKDLGQDFGATLTESEVRYLMEQEWAETADDILWRRSKLGLRMTEPEVAGLTAWISGKNGVRADRGRVARRAP